MYWRFDLKIREQFIVSVFSLDRVTNLFTHIDKCLLKWIWFNTNRCYKWHCCLLLFLAWLITESVYNDAFRTFIFSMQQCIVYMTKKIGIILFNFRFQIGNDRQSKRLLANLGRILFFHFLAHLTQRVMWAIVTTERPSSVVRRPSVNFSHINQLLWSHWANLNQTLVEWSLDGPLPKLCPVILTSNQDGRQAKNRKKGGWNFNCPLLL